MALNPSVGFTIKPKRGFKVTPGRDWSASPGATSDQFRLGITHGSKGWRLGPVRKDRPLVMKGTQGVLNRYYEAGGNYQVSRVYSSRYVAFQGGEHIMAVQFENGERGWITEEGQAMTEEGFRFFLQSMDSTIVGGGYKDEAGPLVMLWDSLGPKQKAAVADALRVDFWGDDDFWEDFGSDEYTGFQPHQQAIYDEMVDRIGKALGLSANRLEEYLEDLPMLESASQAMERIIAKKG